MTAYRFCWWCSKQLRGPYGREALCNGKPVRVHAECLQPMMADNDVTQITCVASCPCRIGENRKEKP